MNCPEKVFTKNVVKVLATYVYAVKKLLSEKTEALEEVKALLRKGDWRMNKVFSKLNSLVDATGGSIQNSDTMREKLLKRMGSMVSSQYAILDVVVKIPRDIEDLE